QKRDVVEAPGGPNRSSRHGPTQVRNDVVPHHQGAPGGDGLDQLALIQNGAPKPNEGDRRRVEGGLANRAAPRRAQGGLCGVRKVRGERLVRSDEKVDLGELAWLQ